MVLFIFIYVNINTYKSLFTTKCWFAPESVHVLFFAIVLETWNNLMGNVLCKMVINQETLNRQHAKMDYEINYFLFY